VQAGEQSPEGVRALTPHYPVASEAARLADARVGKQLGPEVNGPPLARLRHRLVAAQAWRGAPSRRARPPSRLVPPEHPQRPERVPAARPAFALVQVEVQAAGVRILELLVAERRLPMALATAHYTGGVLRIYRLGQPWVVLRASATTMSRSTSRRSATVPAVVFGRACRAGTGLVCQDRRSGSAGEGQSNVARRMSGARPTGLQARASGPVPRLSVSDLVRCDLLPVAGEDEPQTAEPAEGTAVSRGDGGHPVFFQHGRYPPGGLCSPLGGGSACRSLTRIHNVGPEVSLASRP
jgi:hypothetical protein